MKQVFDPVSTYRIQFHKEFNFADFKEIIQYLDDLGIKTVYASPIFSAVPGSMHGYDGIDPNSINEEIGSKEELEQISRELTSRKISWLQDIVPNHMAFHEQNRWLMDVLEKGHDSRYASFFDILWQHADYPGQVMVPFPGSELEKILKDRFPGETNYKLCSWQETDYRMNYRRFFLVNTLICTNIHLDHVFDAYHQLISELVEKNIIHGLRVDHVDGLFDPTKYLNDLRSLVGRKPYIIVEKILEAGENMPEYWPIEGSSGYDFLGIVNNLFTNQAAEYEFTAFYYDLTGNATSIEEQIHAKKRMILENHMRGELSNLVRLHQQITATYGNDFDEKMLSEKISDYLVNCPVYRYYEEIPMMDIDKGRDKKIMRPFYQRCMQFTGPLMAKGVEDTLMYTYNRFIGHNEVGDSPEAFGYSAEQFHKIMEYRQKQWPLAMSSSSTHDTKRGEDVRARLNALTDLHTEWIQLAKQWMKENKALKSSNAPDANDEYFIYQTLCGSFPHDPANNNEEDVRAYPQRMKEYLQKSLREAKIHSTWTEPDERYENATIDFAQKLIDNNNGTFFKSFKPFLGKIVDYGMINSFGQLILKCTCPGVPDVYQGTELWDLSLVDPDNRRPVDYRSRASMLQQKESWRELWEHRWDGAIKLQLLTRLLHMRNESADLFSEGEYIPLQIEGTYSQNVLAYLRKTAKTCALIAIPLHYALVASHDVKKLLLADWKDTRILINDLLGQEWRDMLNGGRRNITNAISVSELFQEFPGAILLTGE